MNPPPADELYRQLHTGNPGDVDFYSRLVSKTDRVLELGCGWGRLTQALARACGSITGIDSNLTFCAAAQQALAPFPDAIVVHHDIRQPLSAEGRTLVGSEYDRIIAPYNLLYALGGEPGIAAAFQFASEHLASGGEFWMDMYPVDAMHAALVAGESSPDDDDEPVGELNWENTLYPILERSTLNVTLQQLQVEYRAVQPSEPDRVVTTAALRHDYLLLSQLERLLQTSGLEITLLLGSFDGTAYDEEAEQLVICAERRS